MSGNLTESPINAVVRRTTNQLEALDKSSFVRQELPTALKTMLIVPFAALAAQALRWYLGFSSTPILPWWAWATLTVLVPIGWLFTRALTQQITISRQRALRVTDRALGSNERLETADDFMSKSTQDGFMSAAIEDAATWAVKGQSLNLSADPPKSTVFGVLWTLPLAIIGLLLSSALANLERLPGPLSSALEPESTAVASSVEQSSPEKRKVQPQPTDTERKEDPPTAKPEAKSNKAVNRQGSAGAAIPESAEESSGKLSEGETRESQQSANPSNAKGSPSASGQPSKSGEEKKRQKKPQKKSPSKERDKKERKQEDKPSGATAGQGSSKGSDNNAAPSDWASTSQSATPDDEDLEDEDQVDDEEEEQESRGGVQPNMRDRRTPVNRDLQIGFGSNRPNPDANGRGGPGGQKKSRGVASLVLGVPIPDRVNGQPNKGRIRITQQRITPETEVSEPLPATSRPEKSSEVGRIHHPEFTPWLHKYVKQYFLEQRAKHPLSPPDSSTSVPDET